MRCILIIFSMVVCLHLEADIERRGAIDIGSGSIKILVADVDTGSGHIVKNVFSEKIEVLLSEDLASSHDGSFSRAVQLKTKEAIATCIQDVSFYETDKLYGVATEAFRRANNGGSVAREISEELNVPIRIISQDEEGEVGFLSAVEISGEDPEHVVVWDNGSGSFQISWKEPNTIASYKESYGKVPVRDLIIYDIQGKAVELNSTPNPISYEDAENALALIVTKFKDAPRSLREKVRDPATKILGVGAIHHGNIACSTGLGFYSPNIIDDLIESRLGGDDEAFGGGADAKYWVSDLILTQAVMSYLGFNEVAVVRLLGDLDIPAPGNTAGIAIKSSYWSE